MRRQALSVAVFFLVVAALTAIYIRAEKGRDSAVAAPAVPPSETTIVAYYFHTNIRCTTCRTIEGYSREVIQQRFGPELAGGRLQFRAVNVQADENRHFVKDYGLFTKSLVLVRFEGGRQAEYRILNKTWELVEDKGAMQAYVEQEVRAYLQRLT
jgi:hypothetical protein